jgi:hypothetical protein
LVWQICQRREANIYAIDRLNRLLRHYGMSEEYGAAFQVDFHIRLNHLDRRAEIKTWFEYLTPDFTYGATTHTRQRQVGERLALHEKLIGAPDAPTVNAYFWLGRDG